MQNAFTASSQCCRVLAAFNAETASFDAKKLDVFIIEEGVEHADRVRSTADTGDYYIRQPARLLEKLRSRFAADDGLQLSHNQWIGVHAGCRAEEIEGVAHIGYPVANRFVDRILKRFRSGAYRADFSAEQLH